MTPTFSGEMQLAGWRESHTSGAVVSFWLPDSSDLEVFKGLTARKGNISGHRMMAVLVEIGDDEQPVEQEAKKIENPITSIGEGFLREHGKGRELAKLAGMWCANWNGGFYAFIRPIYDIEMGGSGDGWGDVTPEVVGGYEQYCRHCILVICRIDSRAELDHNPQAAAIFHEKIRKPFAEFMGNRKGGRDD